jgi:hypothetical protein
MPNTSDRMIIALIIFFKKQRRVKPTTNLVKRKLSFLQAVSCGNLRFVVAYYKKYKFQYNDDNHNKLHNNLISKGLKLASIYGRSDILRYMLRKHRSYFYNTPCLKKAAVVTNFISIKNIHSIFKGGFMSVFQQLQQIGLSFTYRKKCTPTTMYMLRMILRKNHYDFYYYLMDGCLTPQLALRFSILGYDKGLLTNNAELIERSLNTMSNMMYDEYLYLKHNIYSICASIALSRNNFKIIKILNKKCIIATGEHITIGAYFLIKAINRKYYDISMFVMSKFAIFNDKLFHEYERSTTRSSQNRINKRIDAYKYIIDIFNAIITNGNAQILSLFLGKRANANEYIRIVIHKALRIADAKMLSILLNCLKQNTINTTQYFKKLIQYSKTSTNTNDRNHRIIYAIMLDKTTKNIKGVNTLVKTKRHIKERSYDELKKRKRRNRRRNKRYNSTVQ